MLVKGIVAAAARKAGIGKAVKGKGAMAQEIPKSREGEVRDLASMMARANFKARKTTKHVRLNGQITEVLSAPAPAVVSVAAGLPNDYLAACVDEWNKRVREATELLNLAGTPRE